MSKLSKVINRNKKTLSSVFKAAPIATAPFTGGASLAAVGVGSGVLSSFFGNKNKAANITQGLSPQGTVLPTPQGSPSLTDTLLSGVVSYFRKTPFGQKAEAEATTQAINDKILTAVKTPWVWIGALVVVIGIIFLFRKR